MNDSVTPEIQEALTRLGLSSFREGQFDVIQSVLDGEDCLCIMPTGGGKSLCYQLPAIVRPGVTLVVSPLIALMKDQVDALVERGISATYINSTLETAEQTQRLGQLASGAIDLLYVAPERFRSPRFMESIAKTEVQLLAVDEAHCISEWGHDFRHDYARLGQYRQRLGQPQTIALTATATADVRDDVVRQLQLNSPQVFVAGFQRENLFYEVQNHRHKRDKTDALIRFLRKTAGHGIIYASTRKGCEEIAQTLSHAEKRNVVVYHAGLVADERRRVQEAFMQRRAEIVVATNAFGMGIDKADVRFVVHYNIPGSVEAYYQEAGRAGRDGKPSHCLLLYSVGDRFLQEFFIDNAYPPPEMVEEVYEYLRHHSADPIELTQQELKEETDLSLGVEGIGTCERLLEKAGILRRLEPNRNMAIVRLDSDLPTLVDVLPKQATARRQTMRAIERLVGSRRREAVYFRPEELADAAGLELDSVKRSLRELRQLDIFDYVPPFRGRAIQMKRKDVPFDQLDIDFQWVQQRRDSDLQKLEAMVQFATLQTCRQQHVLHYFGQYDSDACGHCDNCRSGRPDAAVVAVRPDDSMNELVRKVLSGVARSKGRFGKQMIAAMLCGSQSTKVSRWKLDRLSTFGLLDFLTQVDVGAIISELVRVQLLEQTEIERNRPVVLLTESGVRVMRGEQPLSAPLVLPQALTQKLHGHLAEKAAQPSEPLESLQPERTRADSENPIPNCHVAPDSPSGEKSDSVVRPNYYWTWRLLSDGYRVDDCQQIRSIAYETVLDHLCLAAESGLQVEPTWALSDEQVQQCDPETETVSAGLSSKQRVFIDKVQNARKNSKAPSK